MKQATVKLPSGEYLFKERPKAAMRTAVPQGWRLLGADPTALTEVEAGEIVEAEVCELCGGDGKETCNNPDHAFIDSMWGDTGRLGCPVCGHDPKHKIKNGGDCDECNGTGKQLPTASLSSLAESLGLYLALHLGFTLDIGLINIKNKNIYDTANQRGNRSD